MITRFKYLIKFLPKTLRHNNRMTKAKVVTTNFSLCFLHTLVITVAKAWLDCAPNLPCTGSMRIKESPDDCSFGLYAMFLITSTYLPTFLPTPPDPRQTLRTRSSVRHSLNVYGVKKQNMGWPIGEMVYVSVTYL